MSSETLESRALLALAVTPVAAVQGAVFRGEVARFQAGDVSANNILDYKARVFWGDGSAEELGGVQPAPGGGFQVVAEHAYKAEGRYNLAVVLQGRQTAEGVADVRDATPVLSAPGIAPVAGVAFNGVLAGFSDPGPDAPTRYVATIDWGDGTPTTHGVVSAGPAAGAFSVAGSHTYTAPGDRPYKVTLTTAGGTTVVATGRAAVSDARLSLAPMAINAEAGLEFQAPIATISDTYASATASDYRVTVDWGDGSSSTSAPGGGLVLTPVAAAPGAAPSFSIVGRHAYQKAGGPTVSIRVERAGGASATARTVATVSTPAVAITAFPSNLVATAGTPLVDETVGQFTTSVPAEAADFVATIEWGDGVTSEGHVEALKGGASR